MGRLLGALTPEYGVGFSVHSCIVGAGQGALVFLLEARAFGLRVRVLFDECLSTTR
jgi:hypothetical protein